MLRKLLIPFTKLMLFIGTRWELTGWVARLHTLYCAWYSYGLVERMMRAQRQGVGRHSLWFDASYNTDNVLAWCTSKIAPPMSSFMPDLVDRVVVGVWRCADPTTIPRRGFPPEATRLVEWVGMRHTWATEGVAAVRAVIPKDHGGVVVWMQVSGTAYWHVVNYGRPPAPQR
ncbi:MAG: hypothetical protein RLZZ387_3301 [Chloroflexota bacterium]